MTRFVQPANQTAFETEHVEFAIAAELQFVSGTIRAHMGVGDLPINGNIFKGIGAAGGGGFGSISAISEKPDVRDTGELYVSLSGVDPALISEIPQRSDWYGQFASIYFLPCDPVSLRVLTPIEPAIFEGFMDQLVYVRKQGSATIQITVKHYDSLFQQTCGLLFTDESHKRLFPTDTFFSQLAALPNKKIVWGGTVIDPASYGPYSGPHGPGGGYGPGKR